MDAKIKILFLISSIPLQAYTSYFATESGNKIEVIMPDGKKKIIFGELNLPSVGSYKIEIPLKSLKEPFEIKDQIKKLEEGVNDKKEEPVKTDVNEASEKKLIVEYDNTDRLVVEANYLFNQGRYYEATIYVEELLRKNPNFSQGWAMKGSLLYVQGYKDLAKKAYDQALKLDPNNEEVKSFLKRVQ